jgi:NAD(P)-dependent dehydrogenase (short-subunit alcohol dehydrogenase family)
MFHAALTRVRQPALEEVCEVSTPKLSGKAAVVTGGGRGIGAAIARRLADMGAACVICGRSPGPLRQTAAEITNRGGRCEAVPCDVNDYASVESLASRVQKTFGRLDILVNNAGIGGFGGQLHTMPLEEWDKVLNTNLRGVFYCIRAFAPMMIAAGGGDIINISSLAGKNPLPGGAAYAASKWGLNGLTYSVAEELRTHNIRVATICPGSTHTELSPHSGRDPKKLLQPDDVAHVVAMLVMQEPQSFASEVLLRPTQKP